MFEIKYMLTTVPKGMPVKVSKAGRSFLPTISANLSNGPWQGHPGSRSIPALGTEI